MPRKDLQSQLLPFALFPTQLRDTTVRGSRGMGMAPNSGPQSGPELGPEGRAPASLPGEGGGPLPHPGAVSSKTGLGVRPALAGAAGQTENSAPVPGGKEAQGPGPREAPGPAPPPPPGSLPQPQPLLPQLTAGRGAGEGPVPSGAWRACAGKGRGSARSLLAACGPLLVPLRESGPHPAPASRSCEQEKRSEG